MKPIEPGCFAIITEPRNFGWPVKVLYWVLPGDHTLPDGTESYSKGGMWAVQSLSGSFKNLIGNRSTQKSDFFGSCPPCYLMRIDGDEDQFKGEQSLRVADKILGEHA